jgi:hypothetical protein
MAKAITRVSITIGAAVGVETRQSLPAEISLNEGVVQGMLCSIKVVTPNFTNVITSLVKLYDRNGVLMWSSAALAENSGAAGYFHSVSLPLTYGEYFTVTPSGVPGGAGGIVTCDCDYYPDSFGRL